MKRLIGKSLCWKYKEAVWGVANSKLAFDRLHETADADQVSDGEAQEKLAQEQRHGDPTAMDIYEVQLQKGYFISFAWQVFTYATAATTRKQQELQLLAEQARHPGPTCRRSVATWLAEGLSIEEAQVTLQMDVKRLGRRPTDTQKLQISH